MPPYLELASPCELQVLDFDRSASVVPEGAPAGPMATQASPPTRIRFDSFEVDTASGELRKGGIRLRLQPQPFRVLLLLIEASGQVVTREEIRDCLWKNSTFVDFEHGINFSINQIRGALSDNAEHPRYVETLPRRGYRFLATVERTHLPIQNSAQEILTPKIAALQCKTQPVEATVVRRRWTVIAAAVLAAALAGTYFYHFLSRRQRVLPGQGAIVLADFANTTGDPAFDGTLRRALTMQLKQSPFLSVLSEARIRQTLPLMGQSADAPLTRQVARELCMRTGSTALIEGSIASLGTHYVVSLNVINCRSGDSLAEEQVEAVRKEDVLKALGDAATRLRRKLGESLSTVAKFDTPLEVTTPSLEALQAHDLGIRTLDQGNYADAVPLFQRAIRLDPNFVAAYNGLSAAYSNLGENTLAAEYTKRAYEMSGRLSEPEKLSAEAAYYSFVTGDLEKERETLELWARIYPRDPVPPFGLVNVYENLGQYEKALDGAREAVRLDPSDPLSYAFLTDSYLMLNRLGEARNTIQQAQKIGADSALHGELYLLAFLKGDTAGMSRQLVWAAGKPGIEDLFLGQEADTSAYYGRLVDARGFSQRAVASAEQADLKETSGDHAADIALIEALMGNQVEARKQANLALKHSTGRDVQYGAALALALTNDSTKASSLTDDLAKRFPDDTLVQFNYLPTLRAQFALNRKSPMQALDALQAAVPYDLAIPPTEGNLELNLYPVYVRGSAYLAAHRGAEAAAEFNKILDQRGAVSNEPIGALAHLGLGRAYAVDGEIVRSRAAYQELFSLWKNADPGISRLVDAKAEYARLK
jgi:DNA-binding winged helix-turn-helix (wHTH) protein/tetratricopeptide (TPR) repeat protein